VPKVLYIIDTLQTGGAERSTLDIASRLTKFQPVVCQIYPKDDLSKHYAGKGIIFENLAIAGKYEFRKAIAACRQLIRKHRPVLVIGTLMRAEIIARVAAKREGVPVLGTFVNDTYSQEALGAVSFSLRLKIRFFQLLNAYTARFCAAFLANAEAIKDSNARAFPK
jgi:UDP-N-acetylglucosamine:LPS N-acetylglucosamine transferase